MNKFFNIVLHQIRMSAEGKEAIEKTGEAVAEKSGQLVSALKSSWQIILIVVAMFLLVLVVIYIVYMIKKNKLQNVSLQTKMISLNDKSIVPYKIPATSLSLVTNGQEFSYSFWIILSSNYDQTSSNKLILQRGNNVTDASFNSIIQFSTNTNPIILLDSTINKMYICIATTLSKNNLNVDTIISTKNTQGQNSSGYIVTSIDYVPLQRWVFVGLVIKDYTLYIFLDGDLYSATTVYDVASALLNQSRPIIKGTNGDLYLGEKLNTTQGFISNSRFFNYALTQKEMKSYYDQGPMKSSILSMIGMKNYGVRSPIYELT